MSNIVMVSDRNDNDNDFSCPKDKQSPLGKSKKMLFTDGQDYASDALHICAFCKRVKDKQGKWHKVDRRMILLNDVKLIQDVCDCCMQKNK